MNNKLKITMFVLMLLFVSLTIRAQEETLTNQDIIALAQAGAGKALIIEKIRASTKANFDLSTNGIIALKKAQIDDDIVSEMLKFKPSKPVPMTEPSPETETTTISTNSSGSTSTNGSTDSTTITTSDNSNQQTDPTCMQTQLGEPNVTNRTRDICDLVRFAVATKTPKIEFDNASRAVMSVFLEEFLKKNKIALSDAEKTQEAVKFFLEAEKERTDKQVGSNPNSSGTTSIAVKGGAPSVIGWAIEQGAATSSTNGTTVTVRVNPFGLLRAIQGEGFLSKQLLNSFTSTDQKKITDSSTNTNNFLRKLSLGFSFDTTRGQETPTFIVSRQQLSAVSARYEFVNQRTPQSSTAQKLFREFVLDTTPILTAYGNVVSSFTDPVSGKLLNLAMKNWLDVTNAELQTVQRPKPLDLVDKRRYEEAIRAVIEKRLAVLPIDEILNDAGTKLSFQRFAELTLEYVAKRKKFAEEVNKGTVVTFEYTNFREPVAPDTSNFRFIYENGKFLKKTDFTFNASLTIYNKKPNFANVKRIRDFQFALQTDTKLGDTFGTGITTLSFAGRYERLNNDTIDSLGVVTPGTKGDIAVGQIKYTIPIADWGIKLPLSITFANRSELIKESHIRANFGFTFDLDPLFARFKPF